MLSLDKRSKMWYVTAGSDLVGMSFYANQTRSRLSHWKGALHGGSNLAGKSMKGTEREGPFCGDRRERTAPAQKDVPPRNDPAVTWPRRHPHQRALKRGVERSRDWHNSDVLQTN